MVSSSAAAVVSDTAAPTDNFPHKLEIRNLTIRYGNTVRTGSPEYARALESQVGEQVGAVREQITSAANSVRESEGSRQERTLERTRDLVREMESLRNRTANSEQRSANGGGGQQPGQGQQPGR